MHTTHDGARRGAPRPISAAPGEAISLARFARMSTFEPMSRALPRHAHPRLRWRRLALWTALCLACVAPRTSIAAEPVRAASQGSPGEKPRVHLDRLDFPDLPGAAGYKKHLVAFLRKEARRVRWGAGSQNRIEYRFQVTELSIRMEADVLRVSCTAVGRLPGNKSARSRLTFGGDPARKTQVVHQVLEIVARGVLTRLAELERQRRGLD